MGALSGKFPEVLITELLSAHAAAKQNFYFGGNRLNGVEGGRFCEASYRMLQHWVGLSVTPLGTPIDADALQRALANFPKLKFPDSIRLHIPRALRVVYDVRNERDIAHLADGIDPNVQDASLVSAIIDWVLAEWVRLSKGLAPDRAQELVSEIVERKAPVVQMFGTFPKVLNPNLNPQDFVLVLLYQQGVKGATFAEIERWVTPKIRDNLPRTLRVLVTEKAFVHHDGQGANYAITLSGSGEVERRRLFELD